MGCTRCKKVAADYPEETFLEYRTVTHSVEGKRGNFLSVTSPLILSPHQPKSGWGVKIVVNTQIHEVKGATAKGTVLEVQRLLAVNHVEISTLDVWYNLNVQWLKRSQDRHCLIDLETFLTYRTAP